MCCRSEHRLSYLGHGVQFATFSGEWRMRWLVHGGALSVSLSIDLSLHGCAAFSEKDWWVSCLGWNWIDLAGCKCSGFLRGHVSILSFNSSISFHPHLHSLVQGFFGLIFVKNSPLISCSCGEGRQGHGSITILKKACLCNNPWCLQLLSLPRSRWLHLPGRETAASVTFRSYVLPRWSWCFSLFFLTVS